MPTVTMPQLGESVAEGTIGRWLKQPGDRVAKYEALVEVVTDKVNAEIPSPFEGVLAEILVPEGATVPNGAALARIEGDEAAAAASPEAAAASTPSAPVLAATAPGPAVIAAAPSLPGAAAVAPSAAAPSAPAPSAPAAGTPAAGTPGAGTPAALPPFGGRVTPAVRRLARESGVDLNDVQGTGHDGRVTREDVLAYVQRGATASLGAARTVASPVAGPSRALAGAPQAASATPGEDHFAPMTQMRKAIAAQMTRALAAPHAYLTLEVDMSGVVALRESSKAAYQAREGIGLSYVPFVTKAAVEGLRRHPGLNAHWTDQGLLVRGHINVGVAVAVDDGLIVPVVHDADRLSVHGLNRAIHDLADRARSNRLRLEDVQGGTFTVDNTGWFGSVLSGPIVNVPEIVIVTMEAIVKRPVVVESAAGDAIAIRPIMNLCASFDHRATDGAQVGRLMEDMRRWLEAIDTTTPIW